MEILNKELNNQLQGLRITQFFNMSQRKAQDDTWSQFRRCVDTPLWSQFYWQLDTQLQSELYANT